MPFCLKTETRKRARFWNARPKSAPPFSSTLFICASVQMERMSVSVSSGSRGGMSSRSSSPWMRSTGGSPTAQWRSEAPLSQAASMSWFIRSGSIMASS